MALSTKSWLTDLLLLTVLIGIFYSALLGTRSLMAPDEGRYAEIAREMATTGDYITPRINGIKYFEKPPFYYWVESFSIKTFGLNEFSLRFFSALMGLLGCLMTYVTTRKLYGRRSALLASVILASSGLYYIFAHFVTLDMCLSVLLSGSLFCFILGNQESPGWRRNLYMWGMYLFAALATLTKGFVAILLPGLIIFTWLLITQEWRRLKTYCLFSGSLLFLLIATPWHLLVQLKHPEFFHFYFIEQHLLRYLTDYAHRTQASGFLFACLILGFFPWTAFLIQAIAFNLPKTWKECVHHKESIFFILWAALIFIFFSFSHSQLIHYILPIFPALAILTGRYINEIWEQKRVKSVIVGFIIILILGLGLSSGIIVAIQKQLISLNDINDIVYIHISLVLLILMTLISTFLYSFSNVKIAFTSLFVCTALLLISLNMSYFVSDSRSVKSFALTVKPLLQKDDRVIAYHHYFQDLPLYLEKQVTVVGFQGELEFGIEHQKESLEWMIDDDQFMRFWQSDKRLFMVMRQTDYHRFLENDKIKLYLLAETSRNVLVANKSARP